MNFPIFLRTKRSLFWTASLASGLLLSGYLLAAPVDLSDSPLGTEPVVEPNIWMTVDDSSSMLRTYNPEYINNIPSACWTGTSSIAGCNMYDETNEAMGSGAVVSAGWARVDQTKSLFQNGHPPLMVAAFNGQAYNPLVKYDPPKKADGSLLAEKTASSTGNWTRVEWQDGAAWYGRPYFDFTTAKYKYNPEQSKILFEKYMVNADPAIKELFNKYNDASGLPPHYYKTSLMWCNKLRAAGDADPGGASFSNCQDDYHVESGFQYPYYYSPFGEHTGKWDNTVDPAFELVILDFTENTVNGQGSIEHEFFNEETGEMEKIVRSFDEEAQNYANWAAYYKNRLVATKSAASHAFSDIDSDADLVPRVGFSSINRLANTTGAGDATNTLSIASFKGAQRTDFFTRLFDFGWTWGGTPLQGASHAVGKIFEETGTIIHSCQRNYHILFTDGMWNGTAPSGIGNVDGGTVPAALDGLSVYGKTLTTGSKWPDPILDHNGTSTTLADIALHYWMRDLKSDMRDDVFVTSKDPARWQHLNFTGMGYGVRGTLPAKNQSQTLGQMGSKYNWPAPSSDNIHNVDDLWHASVNGFGRYVSAASPDEFRAGLRSILTEIMNIGGARASSTYTSKDMTFEIDGERVDVDHFSVSFDSDWTGDVKRKAVDRKGVVSEQVDASAAGNLRALLADKGHGGRNIITRTSGTSGAGAAVPFRYENLTPEQRGFLGRTELMQKNMIDYLRGDSSREGDSLGQFRARFSGVLGDIVDAQPAIVSVPYWYCTNEKNSKELEKCQGFSFEKNPGFKEFYEKQRGKHKTLVFAASNDGMLHAFDRDLNELWAYVPMDIIRDEKEGGIAARARRESDFDNPFEHYFYVNATPLAFDAKSHGTWKTLLVGGLGKGGTSYYALDVTTAEAVASEADATSRSQWEFTDDNMGYTYGRPILAKTKAWGYDATTGISDEWVAILPSGFNNGDQPKGGDGRGRIFFVDLTTGEKLHEMATPDGSPSSPLGLVHIAGYIESSEDQLITAVYGGDQEGNLWRFNLEGEDRSKWTVEKVAELRDRGGNKQWVTTMPWIQLDGRGNRWVFVGTGGFRNDADLTSSVGHTFYAIKDGTASTIYDSDGKPPPLKTRSDLTPLTNEEGSKDIQNGWYEDMGEGYHVNIRPQSAFGSVAYAANKYIRSVPGGNLVGDLCEKAVFEGRLFARGLSTGESALMDGKSRRHYITEPRGITGFTYAYVEGDEVGSDGKKKKVGTLLWDTTDGVAKNLKEDEGIDLEQLDGGNLDVLPGIPSKRSIRFINVNR